MPQLKFINRNSGRVRRGTALVETAMVMIILFMCLFGMMEYGWMFLKQQQITNTARQAARVAATPDATATTVNNTITNLMTDAGMPSNKSGYTVANSNPSYTTATAGAPFSITISVPYNKITITKCTLIPVPTTLTAKVWMTKEGP